MYKWDLVTLNEEPVTESEINPLLARILASRGFRTATQVQEFLYPDFTHEHDPYLMAGMEQAVVRIEQALESDERILIHGDYDADGVTASALLSETFSAYGLNVEVYIPTRADGYGLQMQAIDYARENGFGLIVTVDCGITACAEAEYALTQGIDLIITDHHTPAECVPVAAAVINPKLPHCHYPFKDLAGVGVAYKLASALLGPSAQELLDLVAVGTVADLVALVGENRLYVKQGLEELATPRLGLGALMNVASIDPDKVTAGHIGYMLAPRLNAAGRLQDASLPLELLLTSDFARAEAIAKELDLINRERQSIEQTIVDEALTMVVPDARAIVLYRPHWPHGVVGIVASRLVERYYRPTILLCRDEDGSLRGSGRSIAGFDLIEALKRSGSFLKRYGGHAMAAGLSLDESCLEGFIDAFSEVAAEIPDDNLTPRLRIDAQVELADLTQELLHELELLAPFGMGNPQPMFATLNVRVANKKLVGKQQEHLRLTVGEGVSAIMFGQAGLSDEVRVGGRINLAYRPSLDTFQGRESISLRLYDLIPITDWWVFTNAGVSDLAFNKLPQEARDRFFKPAHMFKSFMINTANGSIRELSHYEAGMSLVLLTTAFSQTERLLVSGLNYSVDRVLVYNGKGIAGSLAPQRLRLAQYYKFFSLSGTIELSQFAREFNLPVATAYTVAAGAVHIFSELGLIEYEYVSGSLTTTILPTTQKQDLSQSDTFVALHTWIKEDVS